MFHDIHGLKDCPQSHRKIITKFYAIGLHISIEGFTNGKTYVCADFAKDLFYQPTIFVIAVTF